MKFPIIIQTSLQEVDSLGRQRACRMEADEHDAIAKLRKAPGTQMLKGNIWTSTRVCLEMWRCPAEHESIAMTC